MSRPWNFRSLDFYSFIDTRMNKKRLIMRTYNANLYADHIENLLNETPTPFLDVDELSYLKHLSDMGHIDDCDASRRQAR